GRLDRVVEHVGERDSLPAYFVRAEPDPRRLVQIVRQANEMLDLAVDDVDDRRGCRAGRAPEQVDTAPERRERISELVRERREELVLVPVGLAQRLLEALVLGDVRQRDQHSTGRYGLGRSDDRHREITALAVQRARDGIGSRKRLPRRDGDELVDEGLPGLRKKDAL